jgi:hypothetical protein
MEPDIRCDTAFENHPEGFAIVDALSVFMWPRSRRQNEYHSGKFK